MSNFSIFKMAFNAGCKALNIKTTDSCGNMRGLYSDIIDHTRPVYIVDDTKFSSLKIKIPLARSHFVKWCKNNNKGFNTVNKGGYFFWIEDGKTMAEKKVFAKAFSDTLKRNDIKNEIILDIDKYIHN